MRHIDPATIPFSESHRYLLSCVAPRPIAFVGTMDGAGNSNLSPFSFFNAFGANPPVIAFSPSFRGTDGSPKHTLLNIKETGEFTVSIVSYSMVEQVSLASSDYPADVDEFVKAGFTKLPSEKIAPYGVAESPMVMECTLLHHIELGGKPGSGNLIVGEVVMFHIKESIFDGKYPSAERLDLVGRMGGPYYSRANGDALFELPKPSGQGIGFDGLPEDVKNSSVLTGNDLAKFAGSEKMPASSEVRAYWEGRAENLPAEMPDDIGMEYRMMDAERASDILLGEIREGVDPAVFRDHFHKVAQLYLVKHNVAEAWYSVLAPTALTKNSSEN